MNDLIALIEGAAPTLAAALIPGPLGSVAGSLATVAVAHLAEGLGLPHPSTPDDIIKALSGQPASVQDAILTRADANFQNTLSPVLPSAPAAPEPLHAAPVAPPVATHTGVTLDMTSMVIYMVLSAAAGFLAHKGIMIDGIVASLTGSPDLLSASAMFGGVLTVLIRNVRGSNTNTLALASDQKT
jgi:hypothetical protein